MPDAGEPRLAYQQIAEDLRSAISEGRLQPGDRLPTEREHAARYGVAVGTYRQALAQLREQGWLATHRRHGTVVLPPEQRQQPEAAEFARRLDLIEAQLRQVTGLVSPSGTAAGSADSAPIAERLAELEAGLARISEQVRRLASSADQYDDLRHSLAQLQEDLDRLGAGARPDAGP